MIFMLCITALWWIDLELHPLMRHALFALRTQQNSFYILTTLPPPPLTLSKLDSALNPKYLASLLYVIPSHLRKRSRPLVYNKLNGATLPPCGDEGEDES